MGNLVDALQIFDGEPEDFYNLSCDWDEIILNPEPVTVPISLSEGAQ